MKYTEQQLLAAYALNLCTVSVSQIIDYADVNIMEQEYEAILNNLNLEQMPKDEALLNILKQILDTITSLRIGEEDKALVEREYQQKMKNGIWEAVPNLALIIAGTSPLTMSLSLISQIGIGYMNYRRSMADREMETERQKWQLSKDALEKFNSLRRNLFDTAWRLSDKYGFSDELRLSEKQIRQYDMILMDEDPIRRFDRLDMIKGNFGAYPPFWYYYGNTANAIANSSAVIDEEVRKKCRKTAFDAFRKFRTINQYDLLREDCIASANALEMADLLDPSSDRAAIHELTDEAVAYSGNEKDILQLAAMEYLNIGAWPEAAKLLRQLVNEQYNTVMNAQLLSGIYVYEYRKERSDDTRRRYQFLAMRVGKVHLYPFPEDDEREDKVLEEEFGKEQKKILFTKYRLAFRELAENYAEKYRAIIPVPEKCEDPKINSRESVQLKKEQILRVFSDKAKAEKYIAVLRDTGIPFKIIDLLNEIFESCCRLNFMGDAVQDRLFSELENAIYAHQDYFAGVQTKLNEGSFSENDMEELLDKELMDFTSAMYMDLGKELTKYIYTRDELLDCSIAEQNLLEFCRAEGLTDPNTKLGKEGSELAAPAVMKSRRLEYQMLGSETMDASKEITNSAEMLAIIKEELPKIMKPECSSQFFLRDDTRLDRYFSKVYLLKKDQVLKSQTLAVLDGTGSTFTDLIFTTRGIVTARGQFVSKTTPYDKVELLAGKRRELLIDGWYSNEDVDQEALYALTEKLKEKAEPLPETSESWFGGLS